MRKLLVASVAVLSVSATPVGAQTPPPEPTSACPASEQFAALGITGRQESFAPQVVPSFPYDIISLVQPIPYREESVTRFRYRVDVSGSATKPFANNATVTLNLAWNNNSDFDLFVYDKDDVELGKSTAFNPLVGSRETVTLLEVPHCTDLRIDVVNYLGLPNSALVLDSKVTNLKP